VRDLIISSQQQLWQRRAADLDRIQQLHQRYGWARGQPHAEPARSADRTPHPKHHCCGRCHLKHRRQPNRPHHWFRRGPQWQLRLRRQRILMAWGCVANQR